MKLLKLCATTLIILGLVSLGHSAEADFYQDKTIHLIVGTGAGGGFDTGFRS